MLDTIYEQISPLFFFESDKNGSPCIGTEKMNAGNARMKKTSMRMTNTMIPSSYEVKKNQAIRRPDYRKNNHRQLELCMGSRTEGREEKRTASLLKYPGLSMHSGFSGSVQGISAILHLPCRLCNRAKKSS
jgi:hypothetical protein